jgi:tetratricopeptide (TPR) repeat protein
MRRLAGPFFVVLFFFLLFPRNLGAQAFPGQPVRQPSVPRLEADSRAYAYSEKLNTEQPRWQDVLDAALWASGWDGSGRSRDLLIRGIDELLIDRNLPEAARQRGEYILEFMHRRFLQSYAERQTRLDVLTDGGRFNCVSSAVLYAVLARAASLDIRGVITRDHAFITLDAGDELIDIETTNSFGFDPGSRREFHDRFGRTTGFAYVPARSYRERQDLSILELVSVILSNRIAEAELSGRFYESPGLALDRAALLSQRQPLDSPFFTDPEQDIKTRLMNYGAYLVRQGREEDALAWEDAAFRLAPDTGLWDEFAFTCLNNLLVKSIRAGNTAAARLLLDENQRRLSGENYARLDLLVCDAEMVELSTAASGPEETEEALAALALSNLENARRTELREFVILTEGNRAASDGDWPAAIAWLEDALRRFGPSARISNALRVYRSNRAADLHNGFADLYNKRDYEAAREWIQRALAEFPDNRQLATDRDLVERAIVR